MHPIHGLPAQPIPIPLAPPPLRPEGNDKPFSVFLEVDPDGKKGAGSGATPDRKDRREEASTPAEEPPPDPAPPTPPAASVRLGLYTRNGNPQTTPPPVGGKWNGSV